MIHLRRDVSDDRRPGRHYLSELKIYHPYDADDHYSLERPRMIVGIRSIYIPEGRRRE